MALTVGNLSAHRPQYYSFRAGQIISLAPSAEKWGTHLVQSSTRRFLSNSSQLGLKNSTSSRASKFVLAVQAKSNGRTPSQDKRNATLVHSEAVPEDPPPTSTSQETPSSPKTENLVKKSVPLHELRQGEFLENRMLYRQKFVIRSYEVGADRATSITTIFSFFQVSIYTSKLCLFSPYFASR
jgi:hypothetical protein